MELFVMKGKMRIQAKLMVSSVHRSKILECSLGNPQ